MDFKNKQKCLSGKKTKSLTKERKMVWKQISQPQTRKDLKNESV